MHWVRAAEDTVQSLPFVNNGDEDFVFIEVREFFRLQLKSYGTR
jgi:hypothetical protein